jgi:hypothetical protein
MGGDVGGEERTEGAVVGEVVAVVGVAIADGWEDVASADLGVKPTSAAFVDPTPRTCGVTIAIRRAARATTTRKGLDMACCKMRRSRDLREPKT